ncbi:MAG: aminoglycoside phosphotransferase family protein [Acidimicrobiales bacterium]|nr:aminoglycoside phosphotransferase family protein [Acidimicrobiales bacterium]
MVSRDSPAAEVEITAELVRTLLQEQHSDLAGDDLTFLAEGWDNVQFRLGNDLIVRLPRRKLAVRLIEHEQRWLPELVERLPLPIPCPVRIGRPGATFSWPWSIVPWVQGRDAISAPVGDTRRTGELLGVFLRALHQPAPDDAPHNPHRGVPIEDRADRDGPVLERLITGGIAPDAVMTIWDEARAAPAFAGPPVWLHGDAHAGNMVVRDGLIVSMIDWGDITSGDPASDLVGLWMVLDPAGRAVARAELGYDDPTWTRARGWAVLMGAMLLANSDDRPQYRRLGQHTIAEVLASS